MPSLDQLFRRVAHAFEGDPGTLAHRRRRWLARFRPGERVLDLGCGDGFFMEMLREMGAIPFGVEVDPEKVAIVERKGLHGFFGPFEEFFAAAAEHPAALTFDGVMLGHVIEHLRPMEALSLLQQCVEMLNPDGRLIVLTPNIANPIVQETFWLDLSHERPYPKLLLERMLHELGCTVESGFLEQEMEIYAVGTKRIRST